MPKRKRDGNQNEEQSFSHIADHATRHTASRFKAHFDNGVKTLTAQIKLARAFDRQKMTRRIKQAGSDPKKLERLQAELAVLKDLDGGAVAGNYLLKQCVRTKKIRECPGFIAVFGEDVEGKLKGTVSTAEANVLGRLFKSNPVGEVLPRIMRDIRTVLDVDGDISSKVKETTFTDQTRDALLVNEVEEFGGFSDSLSEDGAGAELPLGDSEALHEPNGEILGVYESRLAASSDSDSELEEEGKDRSRGGDSMSITSEDGEEGLGGTSHNDGKGDSINHSGSDEGGDSMNSLMLDDLSNSKSSSGSALNSVLPALMNGGYYSGSDSASDFDPDKDLQVNAMATIRKNRRGQKARQAIAEKKHGSRAKHLLKMNDEKARKSVQVQSRLETPGRGRENGWDPRRGAVGVTKDSWSRRKSSAINKHDQRNGFGQHIGGKTNSLSAPSNRMKHGKAITYAPEKPLHPSWEAARKKKLESTGGGSNFIGKKITFD